MVVRHLHPGSLTRLLCEMQIIILIKNCYDVSLILDEFKKNPQRIKEKIKHNKEIIRERKAEAARQKGRFSTEKSVER